MNEKSREVKLDDAMMLMMMHRKVTEQRAAPRYVPYHTVFSILLVPALRPLPQRFGLPLYSKKSKNKIISNLACFVWLIRVTTTKESIERWHALDDRFKFLLSIFFRTVEYITNFRPPLGNERRRLRHTILCLHPLRQDVTWNCLWRNPAMIDVDYTHTTVLIRIICTVRGREHGDSHPQRYSTFGTVQ